MNVDNEMLYDDNFVERENRTPFTKSRYIKLKQINDKKIEELKIILGKITKNNSNLINQVEILSKGGIGKKTLSFWRSSEFISSSNSHGGARNFKVK